MVLRTVSPWVSAPPGMMSLWSKTIHSQPTPQHVPQREPTNLGPVCPRAIPGRSSSLAASQLCLAPHSCRPRDPDSLHSRIEQVELPAALVAGPDASVPPQPLHGHGVALLESGHFVGVLAHDQTGIVLGRDARGASGQPVGAGPPCTHPCKPLPLSAVGPPPPAQTHCSPAPSLRPPCVPRRRAEGQQRTQVDVSSCSWTLMRQVATGAPPQTR